MAAALVAAMSQPASAKVRVNRLLKELKTAQGEEQLRVVAALGKSGRREAVEPLLSLFDIRKASPRLSAGIVKALGPLGDERAVETLIGAWDYLNSLRLQMEELPGPLQVLRASLIESLGMIGGKRAVSVLHDALEDGDSLVVRKAAWGLGRLRDKSAVESLIALLPRGGDAAQSAFEALGEIGDARAVSRLGQEIGGEDALVQAQAAYALARIVGKDSGGMHHLEKMAADERLEPKARLLAAYYLAKLDKREGLDYLLSLLKGGQGSMRLLAAETLGKSGNPRAVLPLAEAADSSDASLRLLVARSLGQLGGARAVYALRKLEGDGNPTVKAAARAALEELGEIE